MAEKWQAIPMVTQEFLDSNSGPGGEGCQRIQCLAIDSQDGNLILVGTDVGGLFRSLDGGKSFTPCNYGYGSTGSSGFAIDPRNSNRILSVGDNSAKDNVNGIYISTNKGESWQQVLAKSNGGRDEWSPICFDASSYDEKLGYCTTAYWLQELNKNEPGGQLYKSEDGGVSWLKISDSKAYGGSSKQRHIATNPENGNVYVATKNGFYVSEDGGKTFEPRLDGDFNSLAMIPSQPNSVWLTTSSELLKSTDGGKTFAKVNATGAEDGFYRLAVSPVDPNYMYTVSPDPDGREWFYSYDGGLTWKRSKYDVSESWIPASIRYSGKSIQLIWHPVNKDVAFSICGDVIAKSSDGAKTFVWNSYGINNIMIGGAFNFGVPNADIMYFASQDYNGGLTKDGGKTWEFINLTISNTKNAVRPGGDDSDPWGWVYGGFSPDGKTIFGGNKEYMDNKYDLWISFDGGKTSVRKVKDLGGQQVSLCDPTNTSVLFCWNQRSADGGQTWKQMEGCSGVYTVSAGDDKYLFGVSGKSVVRSVDHGETWQKMLTLPMTSGYVYDVAYDHINDKIWAVGKDHKVYVCDGPTYVPVSVASRLPKDQLGDTIKSSAIAIDPVDPSIIYVGACGTGLIAQRNNGVCRSVDGGETWESLTCNSKYEPAPGVTAAQMASALRVHPGTRDLWIGSCCYGFWKIGAPR